MREQIEASKHVRCMSDPDGGVLLDLAGGKYFSLNSLGVTIWRLLELRHSREHIRNEIVESFDVPSMTAEQDLDRFVRYLERKGLVRVRR